MAKRYIRINFVNSPSTATPLNATNLNKLDKGVDDLDNAIEDLYNTKLDKSKIADNLITDDASFALSAKQGKMLNDNLAKFGLANVSSVAFGYDGSNAFNIDFNLPNGNIAKLVVENTGLRYLYFNGADWITIWTK